MDEMQNEADPRHRSLESALSDLRGIVERWLDEGLITSEMEVQFHTQYWQVWIAAPSDEELRRLRHDPKRI